MQAIDLLEFIAKREAQPKQAAAPKSKRTMDLREFMSYRQEREIKREPVEAPKPKAEPKKPRKPRTKKPKPPAQPVKLPNPIISKTRPNAYNGKLESFYQSRDSIRCSRVLRSTLDHVGAQSLRDGFTKGYCNIAHDRGRRTAGLSDMTIQRRVMGRNNCPSNTYHKLFFEGF